MSDSPPPILHWRTPTGEEVDFVIEAGGRLRPIEVQGADRSCPAGARHLHSFRAEYPDRSLPGVLLYTGEETYWLTDDVLAVPWWRVVEGEVPKHRAQTRCRFPVPVIL